MQKISFIVTTLAYVLVLSISCNKSKDRVTPSCKIVTVINNRGSQSNIINLTYDEQGRISTVQLTGPGSFTRNFTYTGSIIKSITTQNGAITRTDSVVMLFMMLPV